MNTLLYLLASQDDPLSHVKDSAFMGPITTHMLYLMITGAVCAIGLPMVTNRIIANGTGGRLGGFFESILLFLRDEVARPFLGKEGDRFLPFIWTFFFFILCCNLIGLIPGQATATSNLMVTGGLAAVAFVFYHGAGIKEMGFVHYVKANLLVGPSFLWPLMILIEIMGHAIRPAALAIRLFANMVAGHTMMAVLFLFSFQLVSNDNILLGGGIGIASLMGAVALTFLELLVAFIQAFIFTFLTTVFLSLAVHPEH